MSKAFTTPNGMHEAKAVTWVDASMGGGWHTYDEIDSEPALTITVGWLVKEDENTLVLASSWGYGQLGNLTYIPRGMIKKVVNL